MDTLRQELRWEMFRLSVPSPETFHLSKSNWIPPGLLLIMRFILAGYCIVICVISDSMIHPWYAFFYLTELNYTLVAIHLTTLLFIALVPWIKSWRREHFVGGARLQTPFAIDDSIISGQSEEQSVTSSNIAFPRCYLWFLSFAWMLSILVIPFSIMIVGLFWTLVNTDQTVEEGFDGYLVIDQHGLLLIPLFLNFLIGLPPVRLVHVVYPFFFGWIYIAIVGLLWWQYNFAPYTVLDFSDVGPTLLTCFLTTFVALPVIHLALFGIYKAALRFTRAGHQNVTYAVET